MSTSRLLELNRRLDTLLHSASYDGQAMNQFALVPAANGEYPWQTAQREKQQRRRVGATMVGGALTVGGMYGAKKLNDRYGTKGMDGMKAGAADLVNRADDAVKAGYGKAKDYAGQGMAKLKDAAAPVLDPLKRKLAAGKLSYARGVAQKQGAGKLISRVGRALIHASRADALVELEARLDGALQEFAQDDRKNYAGAAAGTAAAGAAVYGADRAIMNRAKKKMGFTPTRAEAYGEGVKDVMKSGKRMYQKAKVHGAYHAEPLVRKAKGMLGLRKVAGMIK